MTTPSELETLVSERVVPSERSFLRAATQRLDAAKILLNSSIPFNLDAVYLGGYSVECALKSLILSRTPRAKWTATLEEIGRGAKAHDIDLLRRTLELKGVKPSQEVRTALLDVSRKWTTQLRYVGTLVPHKEAEDFLERVEAILAWVRRS